MLNLQNINEAKNKLSKVDPLVFLNSGNSFRFFLNKLEVPNFRHINNLEINFDHPVTVISGTNKVGKTSLLLLIACSHYNFKKHDSTKPETVVRRHTWRDVLSMTSYESSTKNYNYGLHWRVGTVIKEGEGKRLASSKAWTGLGKYTSDARRVNAQIRDREVRLIDLERLLPARNFSRGLFKKISLGSSLQLNDDIAKAFAYVLEIPEIVEIFKIGSHINKIAYLIKYSPEPYSSYNAASGEESLINILVDIFETPTDSLILIDEIEAGFHPTIQRRLADVIQYVSWIHKKQFILTTHSPSILAAFPQKCRKFIDKKDDGKYETVNSISVNAAFSRMDSKSYPLVQLYCEDDEAEFIIKNMLIEINQTKKYFNRLINIIKSGPVDQVKNDYERHKRNFDQMRLKLGYCCVFDGDYMTNTQYSSYHANPSEFSFFLFPHLAPEKFLVAAYLKKHPNTSLSTSLTYSDHHILFDEMVQLGLASDRSQALNSCWECFKSTTEYTKLNNDFKDYIIKVVKHFSEINDLEN